MLVVAALQLGTSLTPSPAPKADKITTTGTFALVRHPMYGGGILIALGWTIIFASLIGLVLTLVLALFLDLKSRRAIRTRAGSPRALNNSAVASASSSDKTSALSGAQHSTAST